MTTYRELIYMCLDLLKGESDDFTYTEEHIAYLLDKYRALLLKQRYGSDPKKHVPYSNYQTISLSLTQDDNISKSTNVISTLLQVGIPRITTDNYYNINFEFVNRERFPFVGNNKYLKKIRYASIDTDNKVVIIPSNFRLTQVNEEEFWNFMEGLKKLRPLREIEREKNKPQ